jgi:hypothetical protein
VVTFPTVWAHILGQLLKYKGAQNIVFGTDSPWYGSPQWQIEALWRFQIPESMQSAYGYPEFTQGMKRQVLGLNSARIYGMKASSEVSPKGVYKPVPANYESQMTTEFKTIMEFPGFTADNLSKMRREYHAMNVPRSNQRHGWTRR